MANMAKKTYEVLKESFINGARCKGGDIVTIEVDLDTWKAGDNLKEVEPKSAGFLGMGGEAKPPKPSHGILAGPMTVGGSGYSQNVSGRIEDATGSGAVVGAVRVVNGAIVGYDMASPGQDYSPNARVAFTDATGAGAVARAPLDRTP